MFCRIVLKRRIKKILFYHATVCIISLFLIFIYKCPFNYFFHIPCPGCGITRAYIAALHLDFKAAFEYHPLFFTVAPIILYTAHRNVLKKHLRDIIESILFFIIFMLFIAIYIFRLFNNTLIVE